MKGCGHTPCLLDCRSDRLGITGLTVPGVDRDLHAYKIMRIKDLMRMISLFFLDDLITN
jgi:hypothetical protein